MIGTLDRLRDWILDLCTCGHYAGDHAALKPHRCLSFRHPQCPGCDGFQEATAPPSQSLPVQTLPVVEREAAPGGDGEVAAGRCEFCNGLGVIEYEDPVIGGLVLASCPDCEGRR